MKFGFIAKHRSIRPVAWLCEALGVSRSGFHAWLRRGPSARTMADEDLMAKVRTSFIASARTYGARLPSMHTKKAVFTRTPIRLAASLPRPSE